MTPDAVISIGNSLVLHVSGYQTGNNTGFISAAIARYESCYLVLYFTLTEEQTFVFFTLIRQSKPCLPLQPKKIFFYQ